MGEGKTQYTFINILVSVSTKFYLQNLIFKTLQQTPIHSTVVLFSQSWHQALCKGAILPSLFVFNLPMI